MRKHKLTLGEGKTPLLSSYTAKMYLSGKTELFYKIESMNPVGGFIDRGMVSFMESAMSEYIEGFTICSDLESMKSAMAYGARCGRPVNVFFSEEITDKSYIELVSKYDGKLNQVNTKRDEIAEELSKISKSYPYKNAGDFQKEEFKKGLSTLAQELQKDDIKRVFIGMYYDETPKIKALKEVVEEYEIEIIPAMLKSNIKESDFGIDNIFSVEIYEAGESMNILRQEGISIGIRDGAALAAVREFDRVTESEELIKTAIIITGSRDASESIARGVNKIKIENLKNSIGLI